VGANVGDYALLVKRLIPAATVSAFEPSARVHAELVRHVTEAGVEGVKTFNLGLSDEERTVELYSYTADGHDASVLSSIDPRLPTQVVDVRVSSTERISVRALDDFCDSEGVDKIDFLKLDVEGHELSVLRGARRMLDAGAISIIQFEFGPANIYSRTFFYDFWTLLSAGYDIHRIIPRGVVPVPFYSEQQEIFLTTNYLALRKGGV
jgi:FkbM family methyltransferase